MLKQRKRSKTPTKSSTHHGTTAVATLASAFSVNANQN